MIAVRSPSSLYRSSGAALAFLSRGSCRDRAHACLLAVTVSLAATSVAAQDSTLRLPPPISLPRSGLVGATPYAGVLVAAVLADHGFRALIQDGRGSLGNDIAKFGNRFGDPLVVVPLLGATFAAGKIAGADGLAKTALHATRAMLVAGALTQVLKVGVGRTRPPFSGNDIDRFKPFSGSDANYSFPSGHTAVAFSVATAVARDVKNVWVRRLIYATATSTAFARINNDKHWLSDVVAGAMLGHFSATALGSRRGRIGPIPGGVGLAYTF